MPTQKPKDDTTASDDLQSQLDALRADIATLAALLQSDGARLADGLRARAEELTGEARARAEAAFGDLRANAGRIEERLEAEVREKPLQSLLMAFGFGLLLSLFLRR